MTTLTQAKKLLASVEHTEYNRTPINAVKKLIAQVENGEKTESVLSSVKSLIADAETLNKLNDEVTELRTYSDKPIKSRAADMAKSRAKADFLRDVRLTPKANEQLNRLCETTELNKTQVINKLLEEQEQLKLL